MNGDFLKKLNESDLFYVSEKTNSKHDTLRKILVGFNKTSCKQPK